MNGRKAIAKQKTRRFLKKLRDEPEEEPISQTSATKTKRFFAFLRFPYDDFLAKRSLNDAFHGILSTKLDKNEENVDFL